MLRTTSFAAVAALLAAVTAHAQDRTADIDKIFAFATAETPGCVVGVSQNGKVIANRAYGLADVDRRVPLGPGSIFDIGSTQKQFAAASILLLVQDGRLALSDDIHKFFPELPAYSHTITVDNLLTHTSGIRDWTGLLPMAEEGTDVLKLILRQRGLNFTPGEEWAYSNSGFELAKEIVARVSGMSFAEFTRRRLFEPLGMKSSSYVPDIMQGSGDRAMAYLKQGSGWKLYIRVGNNRGGGAVITTAGDLLLWNDALTTGRLGKLVTAKIEEPVRLNNGRRLTYARGLMVDSIPGGRMVSHDGGAYGYGTWLGRFTDHGLSIAVLCNFEEASPTSLAGRVADLFLPPVDPQAKPPGPVAIPGVDVTARAGLYFDDRGEPMRLVVNGSRLAIAGGPPLVPVSVDRFLPARASLFYRSLDRFEILFRSNDELELKSMEGQITRYRRAQRWSPSAADLQGLDGRYRSDDLGEVLEILPGTKNLVFRFERTPARAVDAEPVARDTYMQALVIVRFLRDASGKISGFDYSNPVAQNIRFTRLGDRAASSPALTGTRDSGAAAVPPSAPRLEGLVGEYEMAPGRSITITLEGGELLGQPTGTQKQPLVHLSGATFAVGRANGPITVTFTLGSDGRATAMIMRQNGSERTLKRVP